MYKESRNTRSFESKMLIDELSKKKTQSKNGSSVIKFNNIQMMAPFRDLASGGDGR